MLLELSIVDFAIIASSRLSLGPGLLVLTGETGAGKSILLDALGAVLGDRASVDLVRSGARRARIEALFDVEDIQDDRLSTLLLEAGIEEDDGQVILTREIHANGRSVARINGQMVKASLLAQVGDVLVDIHGQSDHFAIRRKEEQRRILDHYAGNDTLVQEVSRLVDRVQSARERIESLATGDRERAQRRDLLAFQVEEIRDAGLTVGEDIALDDERQRLAHAERLRGEAGRALQLFSGEGEAEAGAIGVDSILRDIAAAIQRASDVDGSAKALVERANELVILAEELGHDVRDYLESIVVDEERLLEAEDRLDLIRTLKRKYGSTIDEVIRYADRAGEELEHLSGDAYNLEVLDREREEAEQELARKAQALSERRSEAARRLSTEIEQSIAQLQLGNSSIEIRVQHVRDPGGLSLSTVDGEETVRFDHSGIDDVEILMAANRGEALRSLGRIASGGETARIMLAIKSIVAIHDSTPTLVFDEIDVGVGGRTGGVVGERLKALSRDRQVIVITHLPQIAAMADHHARIEKHEDDGRIVSTVTTLEPEDAEREIAVMLDGEPVTDAAIDTARLMIQRSRNRANRVEA